MEGADETKRECGFRIEQLSLWRELQVAQLLVTKSVLDTFFCLSVFESIHKLPVACSNSRRQRIPRLCVFSSA
jgi:hypothetical protein